MKIIKKVKKKQEGSALLLTVIVLANSLFIVLAITAVSIMEKQITQKTKSATPAFQSAESGIDWAMRTIADASSNQQINKSGFEDQLPGGGDVSGKISCPDDDDISCAVYLINWDNKVITEFDNTRISQIKAVRSVGQKDAFGESGTVTRAIEVQAAPNCPSGTLAFGDFCIGEEGGGSYTWKKILDPGTPTSCAGKGMRLCSIAELITACQDGGAGNAIFRSNPIVSADLADVPNSVFAVEDENCNISIKTRNDSSAYHYICCKNR